MEHTTHKELEEFVHTHVLRRQSTLVEKLIERDIVLPEDISYAHNAEEDRKEIYEWWLVDEWLLERLRERGEPVLRTRYGAWWGRTTTGQAVSLDLVIREIYEGIQL